MAPWIKVETNLLEKGQVLHAAAELGIDVERAAWLCVRMWMVADGRTIDGQLEYTPGMLDAVVKQPGFTQAMASFPETEESGGPWIKLVNGFVYLPDYVKHNGPTAKARALTQQRVARHRRGKDVTGDRYESVTGVTGQRYANVTRGEERRGEEESSDSSGSSVPSDAAQTATATATSSPPVTRRRRQAVTAEDLRDPDRWPWETPEALVAKYNAETPGCCPAVEILSEGRRRKCQRALQQHPSWEFWTKVFAQYEKSRFLRGETNNKNRHGSKTVFGLDWLLQRGKADEVENYVKVAELRYTDGVE